jgi:hypothetical protein
VPYRPVPCSRVVGGAALGWVGAGPGQVGKPLLRGLGPGSGYLCRGTGKARESPKPSSSLADIAAVLLSTVRAASIRTEANCQWITRGTM